MEKERIAGILGDGNRFTSETQFYLERNSCAQAIEDVWAPYLNWRLTSVFQPSSISRRAEAVHRDAEAARSAVRNHHPQSFPKKMPNQSFATTRGSARR
jgi:hypothetical protein